MYGTIIFFINFINLVFIFFLSRLPINYIWGSLGNCITFLQGYFPIMFSFFPISSFSYFLYSIYYSSFIFKLPSLAGGLFFTFLIQKRYNVRQKYKIILSIIFALLFISIFTYLTSYKSSLYTITWLIIPFGVILHNNFSLIFSTMWFIHAWGTITYVIMGKTLTTEQYISLLPVSLIERFMLAIIGYSFYYLANYIFSHTFFKSHYKLYLFTHE
jgi:hypothetical protein